MTHVVPMMAPDRLPQNTLDQTQLCAGSSHSAANTPSVIEIERRVIKAMAHIMMIINLNMP